MENDLISRRAAIDAIHNLYAIHGSEGSWIDQKDAFKALNSLPSAQPQRQKGKWNITDAYPHNVYCSECHTRFAQTHWAVWEDGSLPRNFCPNCGAYMGGE